MSEEQLKAFLEKVKGDTTLQEQLKAAADTDAVLAIAKEAGFSVSVDDLKKTRIELNAEELESEFVAGGTGFAFCPSTQTTVDCCKNTDNPIGKTYSCWSTRCC